MKKHKNESFAEELHHEVYGQIVPFDSQINMLYSNMKSAEDIKLDDLLERLRIEKEGNRANPYIKIWKDLI